MSAKYWIKLYHEILYDPKMARMDDRLWRRTIELFLLAGEQDNDGLLPSLEDIAWKFRVDPEQLETDMVELQRVGIISVVKSNYFVTKFVERQQPMTKAEYMQRKRDEEQRKEYYQPVTNRYQPVTDSNADKKREEEIRGESEGIPTTSNFSSSAEAERIFQEITGFTTFIPKTRQEDVGSVLSLLHQHGKDTVSFCKPFYSEWIKRGYNKTNTAWLDWAVTGEIPTPKKNGTKPAEDESWKLGYSTND